MKRDDPYGPADRTIELLNKKAAKRFLKAKNKAQIQGFDELNIIAIVRELYSSLIKDNEKAFLELAQQVYENEADFLISVMLLEEDEKSNKKAIRKSFKKPTKKWLDAILGAYDPVSLYVYKNEVERKRDRAAEAINSATAKATQFKKQASYWSRGTAHEADRITDETSKRAFKDAGVKKVKWITQKDEKVCKECRERDGKIYSIGSVPDKPHLNCRCYLAPVF